MKVRGRKGQGVHAGMAREEGRGKEPGRGKDGSLREIVIQNAE